MFYNDKPVDWLLDCLIYTKACTGDKDAVSWRANVCTSIESGLFLNCNFSFHTPSQKHCRMEKNKIWLHHTPSLFQHIGLTSSLKGKIQKLKDKQFGKVQLYYSHKNPPATFQSSIVPYKLHTVERAYKGETFFWGLLPQQGDTMQVLFNEPLQVKQ